MVQEGGDICIHIADSFCCSAETNTTLQSNYIPIKKKQNILIPQTLADCVCSDKQLSGQPLLRNVTSKMEILVLYSRGSSEVTSQRNSFSSLNLSFLPKANLGAPPSLTQITGSVL